LHAGGLADGGPEGARRAAPSNLVGSAISTSAPAATAERDSNQQVTWFGGSISNPDKNSRHIGERQASILLGDFIA
jgi:hypothetical protein